MALTFLLLIISGMAVIGWSHIQEGHHDSSYSEINAIKQEMAAYQATVTGQNLTIVTALGEIKTALATQNTNVISFYKEYGGALEWAKRQSEKSIQ